MPLPKETLYRSRKNRIFAGVLGGLAERYCWDLTLLRILFASSLFFPGPQIIFYIISWVVIPENLED